MAEGKFSLFFACWKQRISILWTVVETSMNFYNDPTYHQVYYVDLENVADTNSVKWDQMPNLPRLTIRRKKSLIGYVL